MGEQVLQHRLAAGPEVGVGHLGVLLPHPGDVGVVAFPAGGQDRQVCVAEELPGQVVRSRVDSVPVKGRDTMGVRFAGVGESDAVVAIARNTDLTVEGVEVAEGAEDVDGAVVEGAEAAAVSTDAQDVDASTTETPSGSVSTSDERSTDVNGAATVEDDEAGQEGN